MLGRAVVHEKKQKKQKKKQNHFSFLTKKVHFCLVHEKKTKNGFVFCLFWLFFWSKTIFMSNGQKASLISKSRLLAVKQSDKGWLRWLSQKQKSLLLSAEKPFCLPASWIITTTTANLQPVYPTSLLIRLTLALYQWCNTTCHENRD